jgi:hypothetical protein
VRRPAAVIGMEAQWDAVLAADPHALLVTHPIDAEIQARAFINAWIKQLSWPSHYVTRYRHPTMDEAREAARQLVLRPARMVVIEIGPAQERQQNVLLKSIEEIGAARVVIMAPAIRVILPTVRSRCMGVGVPYLSETQLAESLAANGMGTERSKDVARKVGSGVIEHANQLMEQEPIMASVSNTARALVQGDARLFAASIESWDAQRHAIFMRWLVCCGSGRTMPELGAWKLPAGPARAAWKALSGSVSTNYQLVMEAYWGRVFA